MATHKIVYAGAEIPAAVVNLAPYRGAARKMYVLDHADFISDTIRKERALWAEGTLCSVLRYIPYNPCVVDVGAYTGSSTLWFSTVAGASKVIAVEPDKTSYALLAANVKLSGLSDKVQAFNAAVWDENGFAQLAHDSQTNRGGAQYRPFKGSGVPMRTIDSLMANRNTKVDVLHISMEGYEFKALRGAKSLLEADSPVVIATMWGPYGRSGMDPSYDCLKGDTEFTSILAELGYAKDYQTMDTSVFVRGDE